MTEPFDLNEALAIAYIEWKMAYLTGKLQLPDESNADYCDRMCCMAFVEGARYIQALMQKAFMEAVAETMK
jgi:hypothetical protein